MDADSELKEILKMAVNHAVLRMEELEKSADRRCLFQEYKEWLAEDINNNVWAISADFGHESLDSF